MRNPIVAALCACVVLLATACNEHDTDPDIPPTGDDDDGDDDTSDCVDADGDGWCAAQDCSDQNPLAHPGRAEDCNDGFDNDCNGLADADDAAACGEPTPPPDDDTDI